MATTRILGGEATTTTTSTISLMSVFEVRIGCLTQSFSNFLFTEVLDLSFLAHGTLNQKISNHKFVKNINGFVLCPSKKSKTVKETLVYAKEGSKKTQCSASLLLRGLLFFNCK